MDRLRVKPTIPRCLNLPPLGTVEALSPQAQKSCKACVHTSAEQIRKCMKRTQTSNATYFLIFWMSVKLVNSRRPSDSEFHLKLFLEMFRHVSVKRCIIVRRAIGIQVFYIQFMNERQLASQNNVLIKYFTSSFISENVRYASNGECIIVRIYLVINVVFLRGDSRVKWTSM